MLILYLNYNPLEDGQDNKVWKDVGAALRQSWSARVASELTPLGLTAATSSPLVPLAMLKDVSQLITDRFGLEARNRHCVTMLVDTAGKAEGIATRLEGPYKASLKPWEIYASPSAFEDMRVEFDKSVDLIFDESSRSRYGRLLFDENEHFLYAKALVSGDGPPCFYCGSRKHAPARCPSKQLFTTREALETLGRSSLSSINDCFLRYMTCPQSEMASLNDNPSMASQDDGLSLAHLAFYDIKRVYQLRFFRLFFGADGLDWERIRDSKDERGQGGPNWLALDCLRVGDADRAKHYVETAMEHAPTDWKSACILGFLHIENDNISKAQDYFEKALEQTRRIPQKILLNLLLARAKWLDHEPQEARRHARSALLLDRWCYDALYQLLVLDFELAKNDEPLQGLERLTKYNGHYWVCATLDPDLASFSEDIHPCLSRIASETRHEAEIACREAQRGLRGVRALKGGKNSKILHEAEGVSSNLDSIPDRDGYVNSRERLHGARILKALCRQAIDEQKQELRRVLDGLKALVDEVTLVVDPGKGGGGHPYLEEFQTLNKRIEDARRNVALDFVGTYEEIMAKGEGYTARLKEIGQRLKARKMRRELGRFSVRFLAGASAFLSVTFALTLLFPFLMAALEALVPHMKTGLDDYGSLRRVFILFGVFASLATAAVSSYSKIYGTGGRGESPTAHEVQQAPVRRQARAKRV